MPHLMQSSEMREELRRLYAQDPEARLARLFVRSIADPVKPETKKGRLRPHALVIWLGVFGAVAASVFLYFGFSQP